MKQTRVKQPGKAMLAALAASSLLGASAARAEDTNAPTALKPTVVTGSYIPTAETVGAAPVQTLNSVAIEQAGAADALLTLKKTVPSFTGSGNYLGSVNNNVNLGAGYQAFSGESYVALRNLPTLVLLDGQRIVGSALSGGAAVDLNTIPLAMIERIEVLKDGASAIYGSDAIGGVINIITKKNYNGFEIGGRLGFPTTSPQNDGLQSQVYIIAGASTDTTRFTAGAQVFNQNPILASDRLIGSQGIEALAGQNVTPPSYFSPSYPGKVQNGGDAFILAGSDFAKGGPGYNPSMVTPPVFANQTFTSIPAYNTYAIAHGYTDPTGNGYGPYVPFGVTPTGQGLTAIGSGAGSAWPALNTTDYGTYSFLNMDRNQFWANFDHDLFGEKMNVYSRFIYNDSSAQGQLAPSPVPSLTGSGISIPANNPYNPFGVALGVDGTGNPRVRYRMVDFGNREFDTFNDFFQWTGGLKGKINPDLSYDVSFNYSQDRAEQQTRNAVNGAGLNRALTPLLDGAGAQVFDGQGRPLSILLDAGGNNLPVFNMFTPYLKPGSAGNAQETIDQLRTTLFTWGQSELYSAQGVFNYRALELPAGKINWAFGGQYINEQLAIQVDGLTQLGLVPGLNAAANFSGGSRATTAGFIEAGIPVLSKDQDIPGFYNFEITAAGRYQVFDPGGSAAIPKVGIRWNPINEEITLRASWGEGFIAPTIYNLYGPDFVSNPNITIGDQPGQVQTQTRANPNLEPANSTQFGGGIVWSPKAVKSLTLSADYYHVKEDGLPIADAQSAANSLNASGSGSPFAHGFSFADGTQLATTAPNQVTIDNWGNLIIPWQPGGKLTTDGVDLSANYVLPTDEKYGKISLGVVANVILHYEVATSPDRFYYDYTGTYTPFQGLIPNYNITTSVGYDYKGFSASLAFHYIPGASDPGGLFPEYGQAEQGFTINNPDQPFHIPNYYTFDLQVAYEFGKGKTEGRKWYDGSKFTVGCNNLFNMTPRLIADGVEDNTDKNNYDVVGRFVYCEISKKF